MKVMKKIAYFLSSIILVGSLTSCDSMDTRSYLGTMAGAEIGGTIGEAIGWLSTSRHDGPGKAMMGSVIGTVAGAVIGNQLAKPKSSKKSYSSDYYDNDYSYENSSNYQTGGGYNTDYNYTPRSSSSRTTSGYATRSHRGVNYNNAGSQLSIRNLTYQDEDGDARFGRYETINVIYEVRNNGQTPAQVDLVIDDPTHPNNFAFSPSNNVIVQPGQTIRYKAKAFCKSRPKSRTCDIIAYANSSTHGNAYASMTIKVE